MTDVLVLSLVLATFLLLLFILAGLRYAMRTLPQRIPSLARDAIVSWAFVQETETDSKGVSRKVLKPSPAILAMADQLAPVLIDRTVRWAKANIKIGPPGPGGAPGAVDMGELMKMVPKEWRGIASLFAPRIAGFINGMSIGSKPGAQGTAGNPFLEGKA